MTIATAPDATNTSLIIPLIRPAGHAVVFEGSCARVEVSGIVRLTLDA
jgi:hypothetical protein